MTHAEARRRLLKRYGRMIREIEQMIRDVMWWNNNRTECAPFDCEDLRVALVKAKQIRQIVLKDQGPIPDQLWNEFVEALSPDKGAASCR